MRAAVLGLLVGLLLGFLGRGMFPDPLRASGGAAGEELEPPREVWTPVRDEGSELDLPAPSPRLARERSVSQVELEALAGEVDAAPREAEPGPAETDSARGTGEIRGVVMDQDGVGLEGALVQAWRSHRDRIRSVDEVGGEPPSDSLEDALREAARAHVAGRPGFTRTRTDAHGEFLLEGLPAGQFLVQAFKRDYLIERSSDGPGAVAPGASVSFVARPVVSLPVRVLAPAGELVERAVIACKEVGADRQDRDFYAWSVQEGHLRLPGGEFELTAFAGNFDTSPSQPDEAADMHSAPVVIALAYGQGPQTVELQLEERTGIRGQVVFSDDGVERGHPMVRLMALTDGADVDLERLADADYQASVRIGTEYTFIGLEPGRYAVGVTRGWRGPIVTHRIVEVSDGLTRCDIVVPLLDPADLLTVRVFDGQGRSLGDLSIDFFHGRGPGRGSSSSSMVPMRGSDGSYYVAVPSDSRSAYYADSSPGSVFRLEVSHMQYGSRSVDLERGQSQVEVWFGEAASLEVQVVGLGGGDLLGRARVFVVPLREDGSIEYRFDDAPPGQGGIKRFDALEPGSYLVNVGIAPPGQDIHYMQCSVARRELDLVPGPNAVQLVVPPLHAVDVTVPGGGQGERLSLLEWSEGLDVNLANWEVTCDVEGRARFADVPAGEYLLVHGRGREGRSMRVSVPAGEIVFQPDGG